MVILFSFSYLIFQGESAACNDILRRLYELFASARVGDKFSPHLQLLLRRLPDGVFPFLSNYFVSPGKILNQIAPDVVFKQRHVLYECVALPH